VGIFRFQTKWNSVPIVAAWKMMPIAPDHSEKP
jgi:hypothetical protein